MARAFFEPKKDFTVKRSRIVPISPKVTFPTQQVIGCHRHHDVRNVSASWCTLDAGKHDLPEVVGSAVPPVILVGSP